MRLVLTNDDGIYAPGIAALREALAPLGDLTVVAPDMEQSGVAHSVTLARPLRVRQVRRGGQFFGYAVNGAPADCVKLAFYEILGEPPDLVVSGINLGANVGINALYSGTVAAAVEGAILGVPSMAVSVDSLEEPDFSVAAETAQRLAQQMLEADLPKRTILNVNVPALPREQIRGLRVTRQSQAGYLEEFVKRDHPRGGVYYWIMGEIEHELDDADTDLTAIKAGYISVSPLQYDLTNYDLLEQIRGWNWDAEKEQES